MAKITLTKGDLTKIIDEKSDLKKRLLDDGWEISSKIKKEVEPVTSGLKSNKKG